MIGGPDQTAKHEQILEITEVKISGFDLIPYTTGSFLLNQHWSLRV
jgi:hypothetical protein